MGKSDKKNQVLGDDPLAWLNAGADTDKKAVKKKAAPKKKATRKSKPGKAKPKNDGEAKKPNKEKKVEAKTDDGTNRLVLESSLVINKASEFYESLKKMAASGQDVEIDASKVEVIDSAILQLLFAFVLSLKESGNNFSWHKPTESLLNKASILGLTEQLGL